MGDREWELESQLLQVATTVISKILTKAKSSRPQGTELERMKLLEDVVQKLEILVVWKRKRYRG